MKQWRGKNKKNCQITQKNLEKSSLGIALERNMKTVGDRVREARQENKMSQRRLAEIVGTSQQAIQDLETKGKGGSSHLVPIAAALGVTAEYLFSGNDPIATNRVASPDGLLLRGLSYTAPVIGSVGAGLWRETQLNPSEIEAFQQSIPVLPTAKNERFQQYGLKVEGNSMNKVVLEGEFVSICLVEDGAQYGPGDIVVCERERDGLYETTLKRLKSMDDNRIVLAPESNDPKYVSLVMSPTMPERCRIVAVAIGKYAPF